MALRRQCGAKVVDKMFKIVVALNVLCQFCPCRTSVDIGGQSKCCSRIVYFKIIAFCTFKLLMSYLCNACEVLRDVIIGIVTLGYDNLFL